MNRKRLISNDFSSVSPTELCRPSLFRTSGAVRARFARDLDHRQRLALRSTEPNPNRALGETEPPPGSANCFNGLRRWPDRTPKGRPSTRGTRRRARNSGILKTCEPGELRLGGGRPGFQCSRFPDSQAGWRTGSPRGGVESAVPAVGIADVAAAARRPARVPSACLGSRPSISLIGHKPALKDAARIAAKSTP
jgi:hypothetical protein